MCAMVQNTAKLSRHPHLRSRLSVQEITKKTMFYKKIPPTPSSGTLAGPLSRRAAHNFIHSWRPLPQHLQKKFEQERLRGYETASMFFFFFFYAESVPPRPHLPPWLLLPGPLVPPPWSLCPARQSRCDDCPEADVSEQVPCEEKRRLPVSSGPATPWSSPHERTCSRHKKQ